MVATDTPLYITGVMIKDGLAGNWLWWCIGLGSALHIFLFSRLWRRSEVMTEAELIELRYGGRAAKFLRAFRAAYQGIVFNSLVAVTVTGGLIQDPESDSTG